MFEFENQLIGVDLENYPFIVPVRVKINASTKEINRI